MSYQERLKHLDLYSHQRRRERYIIIYLWRIAELQVPNIDPPIEFGPYSDRNGRLCKGSHVTTGHLGTLCFNSFRRRACSLFNSLPRHLRNISKCNMSVFRSKLDIFLKTIGDTPGVPNRSNFLFDLIKKTVRGGYGVSI